MAMAGGGSSVPTLGIFQLLVELEHFVELVLPFVRIEPHLCVVDRHCGLECETAQRVQIARRDRLIPARILDVDDAENAALAGDRHEGARR